MFAKVENGDVVKYPIHNIRAEFPESVLPEVITQECLPEGYYTVTYGQIPTYDGETHKLIIAEQPVFLNGEVVLEYSAIALNQEELEQRAEQRLQEEKNARSAQIEQLTVTTADGKVFDADRQSQSAMAVTIVTMTDNDAVEWIMADNAIDIVTKAELQEALNLAVAATSQIWLAPYQK